MAHYEEVVSKMDADIKEKDWQLQEMINKHKNICKDLQVRCCKLVAAEVTTKFPGFTI